MSTTPAISEPILLPFEDKNLREPYREYFTTKRKNYQAVVRDVPELWDCFLRLDEIWARDLDQMQIVTEKGKTAVDRNVRAKSRTIPHCI
jgi:hypothetical protein